MFHKGVLKLDMYDNNDKTKAVKIVSRFAGVDSIYINMKDPKLTVTGDMDPVELIGKLRKSFSVELLSIGLAREAQKKDDNKKDDRDRKKRMITRATRTSSHTTRRPIRP